MKFRPLYILIVTVLATACNNNNAVQQQKSANPVSEKTASPAERKIILFFGNSLTAGYGLDDQAEAFPGLIQQKIDSASLPYQVINAGLSGETSSAGTERIDWLLKQKIDVFVLELGANDGLRGISPDETYKNLGVIIHKVKTAWPDCKLLLTGMLVPPSMGKSYTDRFKNIFPELATENDMELVPFLLQDVAGITRLNQKDGIHPTPEGQKIVAANVWKKLEGLL